MARSPSARPGAAEPNQAALAAITAAEQQLPAADDGPEPPPADDSIIAALIKDIDLSSTESIIRFGSEAQQPLAKLTGEILADARVRDTGAVGTILNDAVAKMRGLDFDLVQQGERRSLFDRILGKLPPIVRFFQSFETVESHLDVVRTTLHNHHSKMLEEVGLADIKYETLLTYYRDLGRYILAGDRLLARIDDTLIPEAEQAAATAADATLAAQKIADLRGVRQTLANKVHDLRLTRQAVMQAIPTVRTKQAADKALAEKLSSMIVNGIPLWTLNVANALSVQRTRDAATVAKTVSDFANEQLKATAATARAANRMALEQSSRGLYDLEAITRAHEDTIGMLEDTLAIRAAAEERRQQEVTLLQQQEGQLRDALHR